MSTVCQQRRFQYFPHTVKPIADIHAKKRKKKRASWSLVLIKIYFALAVTKWNTDVSASMLAPLLMWKFFD